MLILLPIFVYVTAYLMVFNELSKRETIEDALQAATVYTSGAVSLFTIIFLEGLGLFSAITRLALIIVWTVTLLVLVIIAWRTGIYITVINKWADWWKNIKLDKFDRLILAVVGFFIFTLFLVAFISPPNNNDSLQYHLARIVHWIQNRNFEFFPVAYVPQLINPPGAEIMLLNNFLLVGGDQLVNLQQWTFMISSLVASSLIAKLLGAGRVGRWLTVVFLLCLPVGILESTSTQNDYVTAFWILALVYLVIKSVRRKTSYLEVMIMGAFAGLAMLTKIPAYPYVAIILIWMTFSNLKTNGVRRSIINSVLILCVMFAMNIMGWVQNYDTFNNPFGEMDFINRRTPNVQTVSDLLISPIQHLALNIGTPFDSINNYMGDLIVAFCEKLNGSNCSTPEPSEWGFRIIGLSNHEDTAGNLLALMIFIMAMIIFVVNKRIKLNKGLTANYLLVTLSCILLFSWLVTWGAYWGRLQLPFFAIAAPFVGLVVGRRNEHLARVFIIIIFLCGMPWLLLNRTRPVIGYTPNVTLVRSIFVEPRTTVLFANYPELEDQVRQVTGEALKTGCSNMLLRIDSRDPEYYFMSTLKPWKTGVWIESISDKPQLDRYKTPNYKACALICSVCGYNPDSSGLIFAYKDKAMTLYLTPQYYAEYTKR
jgi:hypothetical protein